MWVKQAKGVTPISGPVRIWDSGLDLAERVKEVKEVKEVKGVTPKRGPLTIRVSPRSCCKTRVY